MMAKKVIRRHHCADEWAGCAHTEEINRVIRVNFNLHAHVLGSWFISHAVKAQILLMTARNIHASIRPCNSR